MELEQQIMDQAHAMAAISRRHERQDLDAKTWENASAWNLTSFMFFEEVPFLAAFGFTAKDKVTWEEAADVTLGAEVGWGLTRFETGFWDGGWCFIAV